MKVIICRTERRKRQAEGLPSYLLKRRETHGSLSSVVTKCLMIANIT